LNFGPSFFGERAVPQEAQLWASFVFGLPQFGQYTVTFPSAVA